MKYLTLILLLLCTNSILNAQDSTRQKKDTLRPNRRNFDSTIFNDANVLTKSDYLAGLEKVFLLLNKVPVVTGSFSKIESITNDLIEDDSALSIMRSRLLQSDRTLNIRNLQMFQTLLEELRDKNKYYCTQLQQYDSKLDALKKEIVDLRKDTLVRKIFRDSALRVSLSTQLQQLRSKWKNVDSLVKLNTDIVNHLKAHASANTIATEELLYQTDAVQNTVGAKAFSKERRYIWEARTSKKAPSRGEGFKKAIDSEKKLAAYYFANTRSKRVLLFLAGLIFFYWIWYNLRSLKRFNKLTAIDGFHFKYINVHTISAALVFMLNLAPLFDLHAPAIYVESTQLILMFVLTWLFWKQLPRTLFYQWGIFIILFLLLTFSRLLGLPVTAQRWWTLSINTASVGLGVFVLLKLTKRKIYQNRALFAAGCLYLFFNFLAIICNLFGRVTLMQVFGATAVYSFAATVSLIVFVQLWLEVFLLQIQSSRVRRRYPETFEYAGIIKGIKKFITIVAVIIWIVVFATNLNVYAILQNSLLDVLTMQRNLGSFNFTLSGVILFLGIIWIANFLQKYIAYFFGDIGDDAAFDNKGQRSRLLVTRLILLCFGFLLAVAASGLPIDKITVVLGALGVGIGLGLQSIVNNFVSGIILIFDRPLRIGDVVELGSNKGRVKEIGIRSSTLLTDEGAEVIIPNGDVLSNNIVNWTLSNNHIRVNVSFKLEKPFNTDEVIAIIKENIVQNTNSFSRKEPEILVHNIAGKFVEIKAYFWCKDVTKVEQINSEVYADIYKALEAKEIKIL